MSFEETVRVLKQVRETVNSTTYKGLSPLNLAVSRFTRLTFLVTLLYTRSPLVTR